MRREEALTGSDELTNDNLPLSPGSDTSAARLADRLRRLTVWLILASAVVAIALTVVFEVRVDPTGSPIVVWAIAAMLLASRIWWQHVGHQVLADASGTIGVVSLAAMSGGAIAMLELRLGFPKADPLLHRLDLWMPVDGIRVAAVVADHHDLLLPILAPIYNSAILLCLASLVSLSLMKNRVEAWRGAFIFTGTLLTVCGVAVFIPATGLINWAPPTVLAYLPNGFMRHFHEFYYGEHPVLRLQVIDGVISFPSFHAVVGFLVFSMWRQRLATRLAAGIWLAIELLSTVAAGHYVIDLFGGFAVWGAWFALSRKIERQSGGDIAMLQASDARAAAS